MMVLTATQSGSLSAEMVGFFKAGKNSENGGEIVAANVEKQTDFAGGGDGALQHED